MASRWRSVVVLVLATCTSPSAVASPDQCRRGPLDPVQDLPAIVARHKEWLDSRNNPQPIGTRADLRSKDLTAANLKNSDLREALLAGAKLEGTIFDDANLAEADFSCVIGLKTQFMRANLFQANFANATLTASNFTGKASLAGAILNGADLDGADLTGADLVGAKLLSASLINTKLAESDFDSVDVADATWQPTDAPKGGIGTIRNLALLRLDDTRPNPAGMGFLLKALRDAGADNQARDLVSARERAETHRLWQQFNSQWDFGAAARAVWRSGAWGLLTDFGRSPGIALGAAVCLAVAMTGVYFLWGFSAGSTSAGICKVHSKGRIERYGRGLGVADRDRVTRLQVQDPRKRLGWAFLFSLLSSLRIGIGQFNAIELVKRFSSTEVDLAAYGPLRAVSGVQSVLTACLLALWAYTQFGRPFE